MKNSLLMLSLVGILAAGCSSTPMDAPGDPSSNYYGQDEASVDSASS